jgi:hypothetical protein
VSNVQSCVDALAAELNIHASASASCSGNSCEAEAAASCGGGHIAPKTETSRAWAMGVGALAILGGIFAQRRRMTKKS